MIIKIDLQIEVPNTDRYANYNVVLQKLIQRILIDPYIEQVITFEVTNDCEANNGTND